MVVFDAIFPSEMEREHFFMQPARIYPIRLYTKSKRICHREFIIPDTMAVDTLPEDYVHETPFGSFELRYIAEEGKIILWHIRFISILAAIP